MSCCAREEVGVREGAGAGEYSLGGRGFESGVLKNLLSAFSRRSILEPESFSMRVRVSERV